MIHTCLKEVLMVCFVGVLQVKKKITLSGIVMARHMEDTVIAREMQLNTAEWVLVAYFI